MSKSNPNAPPGESALDLLNERTLLEGTIVSAAAYGLCPLLSILPPLMDVIWSCPSIGVYLTIFFLTFRLLLQEPNKTRKTYCFIAYVSCLFVLSTVFVVSNTITTQYLFIDDRNYPGGPNAYAIREFSAPLNVLADVCLIIGAWFADSLLLWRGLVIYRGSPWAWILVFPALMLIGSIGVLQAKSETPIGSVS